MQLLRFQNPHFIMSLVRKGLMFLLLISQVFFNSFKFKKDDPTQSGFVEDLMLFVVKKLLPMRTMESIWLQWMAYMLCPWVVFPCRKTFVEEILPNLVKKTLNTYVVLALANYLSITCTFDLWMSKGRMTSLLVLSTSFQVTWRQIM